MDRKKIFLIDGNSFCYRAFYAIKDLKTSAGFSTNAVYGFIAILNKILVNDKPDYVAIVFDLPKPTFRHKKFHEYKITRKPMPCDLIEQIPVIKEVVKAYNIPIFELEGYEADDIIATIAKKTSNKNTTCFIVTGDKDALQLVDDNIKVYNVQKDGLVFDKEEVMKKYGIPPELMVDFMSLTGDSIDNVPGVPGIGEKTALKLIQDFHDIDSLLKNTNQIKSESQRTKIEQNKDMIKLSKELITLDTNVPIDIKLDDLKLKEADNKALFEIFKRLEFNSLLQTVAEVKSWNSKYVLINDMNMFDKFLCDLEKTTEFSFDFETTSTDPLMAIPVGVSFCWKNSHAIYLSFNKSLNFDDFIKKTKKIFESDKIKKYGQNIKYEILILKNAGLDLKGEIFDTMIASYLLNPSRAIHNLGAITLEYLSYKKTSIESLIGKGTKQITMDKVDPEKVCNYCCEDSESVFRLKPILEEKLKEKNLFELFATMEIPLIDVLARIEQNGVCIDEAVLKKLDIEVSKKLSELEKLIYESAGLQFNINSPKQLSDVLFGKLKLKVFKKTKTGFSTDEEVLKKLSKTHILPQLILSYREVAKIKSTYIESLLSLINPKTKRLHTSFNQTVTATGRLSSSNPNLQNIPIKTELGATVRKAFVAAKNNILICADYSQIELRILAHLSEDMELINAFANDRDIHKATAALIFNIGEDSVTNEMRNIAKTVNFGIVYGMSSYGLSNDLNISVEDAKTFIDSYFTKYKRVKEYIGNTIEFARKNGFVATIFNRRRYIPEINSTDQKIQQFAERVAVNAPIQGSAADFIKLAMIEIDKSLKKIGGSVKMILQVHDELVFEAPQDENTITEMIREKMENVFPLKVPVRVKIKTGKNWLEAKE